METHTYYIVERYELKLGARYEREWRLAVAASDSISKAQTRRDFKKRNEPGQYRVVKITEVREVVD